MGFQLRVRLWERSSAQGFRGALDYSPWVAGGKGLLQGFQISVSVSFSRGGGGGEFGGMSTSQAGRLD